MEKFPTLGTFQNFLSFLQSGPCVDLSSPPDEFREGNYTRNFFDPSHCGAQERMVDKMEAIADKSLFGLPQIFFFFFSAK
jgi:hypothetical protein